MRQRGKKESGFKNCKFVAVQCMHEAGPPMNRLAIFELGNMTK